MRATLGTWQPMTVPNIAVHSINQSCVSSMYMSTSGAQRTTSTSTCGSLPSAKLGDQLLRSTVHKSSVGCTSGS